MPRTPGPGAPRKRVAAATKATPTKLGAGPVRPVAKVAVPDPPAEPALPRRAEEPVWLVRIVLVLFLVGFAAFLAREVYNFVQALG